ncbi:MAG TPA: TonB-dependent receptor plug domain-containing protein, partial [Salinivirga sp.]|uniref:TonB-dependent receptor plug domain-containing protein n=1 Tax=Salinivirga sp. TaxID=1970192 RepID=UPI002B4752EC
MRNLFIAAIFILLSNNISSQHYEVSGKVLDQEGNPLTGVIVKLQPIEKHGLSNSEGLFRFMQIPAGNYTLMSSFIGCEDIEKQIELNKDLHVTLQFNPAVEHLQEVVVVDHHANEKRRQEAQNIEIVNHQFLEQNLGGSLMQSLRRLPGVSSMDVGAGLSKPVLRGLSFNRVVVAENGIKHEAQQWGADHGLEINQHSISEAEVIKGAASLMYGSDAIGGVINLKNSFVPSKNTFGGDVNLLGESINNKIGSSLNLFGRNEKHYFNARLSWADYGDYKVPTNVVNVYNFPVELKNKRMRNTAGQEGSINTTFGIKSDSLQSTINLSVYHAKSGFFANAHGLEPRQVDKKLHDKSARDIQLPYQQVQHLKAYYLLSVHKQKHHFELNAGWQNNLRKEHGPYTNHGFMPDSLPVQLGIPETRERWFNKHTATLNVSDNLKAGEHQIKIGIQSNYQQNEIGGWNFIIPAYDQFTSGLFVYDKWRVNEQFIAHAGIRYDLGWLNTQSYRDWFTTPIVSENDDTTFVYLERAAKLNKQFDNLSYAAGINYNLTHFEF